MKSLHFKNNPLVSSIYTYITLMIIMIVLGASDTMRGIFGDVFVKHFKIGTSGFSHIVTISYIGNLVFMLFGSRFADMYGIKKVFAVLLLLWMNAFALFVLTDSYVVLLIGMFIAMGTSTLMNTLINVVTPLLFASSPAVIVNTLYFVQGIGTSGNQYITGQHAAFFRDWKIACAVLLAMGLLGFIMFLWIHIPHEKEKVPSTAAQPAHAGYSTVIKNKWFISLVLMFGFYFVAEHSVMNWLVLFCHQHFQYTTEFSTFFLSLFFGGMTIGRLIFAVGVQKIGITRSLISFGIVGAFLYISGLVAADFNGKWIFCANWIFMYLFVFAGSGFALSILYPTMVFYLSGFYDSSVRATAVGTIISVATLFDIGFNAVFGSIVDAFGFTIPILVLPVSMILFLVMLFYSKRGYHESR